MQLTADTEGSVTPERVATAARSLLESLPENDGVEADMLAGIHVTRVATQVQMVAVLHTLDSWLEQHPKVRER